jgi:uncharacterized protein
MKKKLLLFGVVAYLVLSVPAGIVLAKMALFPGHRTFLHENQARAIAREMHADLEDIEIAAPDGVTLRAWFAKPEHGNGNAVVLLHGLGDNREGMGGYARMFVANGYTVLLPDSRAHGRSGGAVATYGLLEAGDVHAWVDWLEAREQPKCVYGFGESMGAGIVLNAVGREPRFCGVVAESGFADFRDAAYDRIAEYSHVSPAIVQVMAWPAVESGFMYARWEYGVDLSDVDGRRAVAASQVPVLVIHGGRDRVLRARESEMVAAANPRRVTLWELPRAGHCGAWSAGPEDFQRRVLGFMKGAGSGRPVAGGKS